jgi:hypothetical protein
VASVSFRTYFAGCRLDEFATYAINFVHVSQILGTDALLDIILDDMQLDDVNHVNAAFDDTRNDFWRQLEVDTKYSAAILGSK